MAAAGLASPNLGRIVAEKEAKLSMERHGSFQVL